MSSFHPFWGKLGKHTKAIKCCLYLFLGQIAEFSSRNIYGLSTKFKALCLTPQEF